jgi:hypothetical protein
VIARGAAVALALALAPSGAQAAAPPSDVTVRASFLERCGGCHGVDGRSASVLVPDLRDQVGYFLCTPDGRSYLPRLPNVAFSNVSDARLAELVNYAVFVVGGKSAPRGAARYTAREVGRLRRTPLTTTDLVAVRSRIAEGVIARCPAAEGLRVYKSNTAPAAASESSDR